MKSLNNDQETLLIIGSGSLDRNSYASPSLSSVSTDSSLGVWSSIEATSHKSVNSARTSALHLAVIEAIVKGTYYKDKLCYFSLIVYNGSVGLKPNSVLLPLF